MARRYRFVIAACCLLAAGLRLYKLNDANPWWDEGFTYWLASQDVPGMLLRTAGDTHPPLSYLLYQLWMPLAGRAIYALRFQAVLFGVLTVPVCAALARRLAGQWAGVFAALLLAISPFHIWWSQQIRMYALVALLCALSMCLFVRATGLTHRPVALPGDASLDAQHDKRGQRPEARAGFGTLVALAGVNAAGLYTLYFFAVLVLLEGLFISWLWVQRPNSQFPIPNSKQRVVLPLASCLLPAALLLPWLAYFRQHAITFAAEPSSPLTWPQFLEASWSELTLGIDTGVQAYTPLLIGLGVVAASLLVLLLLRSDAIRKENGPFRPWLLVVAAGLPLAAYGVTLLQGLFFSPAYQTRYDLPALPALIVLLAWGIAEFRVPSSGFRVQSNFTRYSILGTRYFIFALFAGAAVWSLPRQYDSRHRTDDYQSLSRFVQAYERPGDVIVFDPDWNFHLFLLDYRGSLPWRAIPLNQHVDAAWANQVFSGWSREYQSLWLLQEAGGHDAGAQHPVRDWLDSHLNASLQLVSGDRTLTLYEDRSAPPRQLSPAFAPQVSTPAVRSLLGYDQPLDDVRAGDVLNVTLYGSPATPALSSASLSFGGRSFAGRPLPGAVAFVLPVGTWAPGGAQPIAALLPDGSQVHLSSVYVEPHPLTPEMAAPPLAHLIDRAFGGLAQLTSYQVQPERAAAGQEVSVRLQWKAIGAFDANYTVFVHLLDNANHVVAQRDSQPVDGRLPTIAWLPGETVNDDYHIPLPPGLSPGTYQLEMGMYLQSTGDRLSLSDDPSQDHLVLGSIEVTN